jgi:hypothetical protein
VDDPSETQHYVGVLTKQALTARKKFAYVPLAFMEVRIKRGTLGCDARRDQVSGVRRTPENTEEVSRAFIFMSRTLLLLIGVLLAVIPWTERCSTLDSFPLGEDFELSLLAFFVLLGLILLFARYCKQGLSALFAFRHCLSFVRSALCTIPIVLHPWNTAVSHTPPIPSPSSGAYNLPLQI